MAELSPPPTREGRPRRPHNLPGQLTSFIGREAELAVAVELLGHARLVTLTGPGGTGKTRFALQLAVTLLDRFQDGAFFVPLAPVFDPDLVIPTTSQALGVPDTRGRPPLESLKEFLREKRVLLVLDNVEHLLAAGPRLTELLAACPTVTLLVTSRVALRVSGEQELPVAPLALPDLDRQTPRRAPLVETVGRSEAVRLFVERARAVTPGFALTEENAAAVAELCRRLDGLPLAIELAAARSRLLTPASMLALLAGRPTDARVTTAGSDPAGAGAPALGAAAGAAPERAAAAGAGPAGVTEVSPLRFLTAGARDVPARHQTLRDTIGWSYDLLTPAEQALFRRLSIFVGGCTLDAAEAIGLADIGDRRWALAPDEVLDGVESLIAKSLLRRLDEPPAGRRAGSAERWGQAAVEPRFTMLETIREYGLERSAQAGELLALRRWHAGYFLELAEQAEPRQRGPEQAAWLDRLEAEHDNLRASMEWSLADPADDQVALRIAGALAAFWVCRGHVTEGRRWLDRALACPGGPPAARLRASHGAGRLAHFQRAAPAARGQLEAALALARELGDSWALAWTLHLLGRVAYFDGDAATARRLGEESLAVAREIGDDWLAGWALHLLALAAHIAAEYPRARELYEASIAVRRPLGYPEGIGICKNLLGMVTYSEGDYVGALQLIRDSLAALRDVGYYAVPTALATAASIAARLGQPWRGVRLAGATAAFSESIDVVAIPLAEEILGPALDLARRGLGDAAYTTAWSEGRALSLDEAIVEALAIETPAAGRSGPTTEAPAAPMAPAAPTTPGPSIPSIELTAREAAVLRLIAAGRTTREIAGELFVSVATVERHITHLYGKIGARGRADATAYALKHGLV
jgi:non-specific serine/threonine protein kinase